MFIVKVFLILFLLTSCRNKEDKDIKKSYFGFLKKAFIIQNPENDFEIEDSSFCMAKYPRHHYDKLQEASYFYCRSNRMYIRQLDLDQNNKDYAKKLKEYNRKTDELKQRGDKIKSEVNIDALESRSETYNPETDIFDSEIKPSEAKPKEVIASKSEKTTPSEAKPKEVIASKSEKTTPNEAKPKNTESNQVKKDSRTTSKSSKNNPNTESEEVLSIASNPPSTEAPSKETSPQDTSKADKKFAIESNPPIEVNFTELEQLTYDSIAKGNEDASLSNKVEKSSTQTQKSTVADKPEESSQTIAQENIKPETKPADPTPTEEVESNQETKTIESQSKTEQTQEARVDTVKESPQNTQNEPNMQNNLTDTAKPSVFLIENTTEKPAINVDDITYESVANRIIDQDTQ